MSFVGSPQPCFLQPDLHLLGCGMFSCLLLPAKQDQKGQHTLTPHESEELFTRMKNTPLSRGPISVSKELDSPLLAAERRRGCGRARWENGLSLGKAEDWSYGENWSVGGRGERWEENRLSRRKIATDISFHPTETGAHALSSQAQNRDEESTAGDRVLHIQQKEYLHAWEHMGDCDN